MLIPPSALRAARDQRGFTLIEVLIAMITGLIVTGALFSVLEFSIHQTTRLSDITQANQLGRTTMTHIVDELHSACISAGFAPIQATSTETSLVFVSGYSSEAEVPSVFGEKGGVRKDEIEFKEGKMWDTSYPATGSEGESKYTWGTPTKTLIGENISQSVEPSGKKEAIPVFKYFAYATKSSTGTAEATSTLEEAKSLTKGGEKIGTEGAKSAASVLISFNTATSDKNVLLGGSSKVNSDRSADLSSQVTFAFSAPSSEATIEAGPCE
jgi:prepilin-type N-terminal cleavage/methylation domain-containing protein